MNGNLILTSVRKAVLARLSTLGRRFCFEDVDEMVWHIFTPEKTG